MVRSHGLCSQDREAKVGLEKWLREACARFRSASTSHLPTQASPSQNGNLVASVPQLGPSLRTGLRL